MSVIGWIFLGLLSLGMVVDIITLLLYADKSLERGENDV